jgi:hypothetical protein
MWFISTFISVGMVVVVLMYDEFLIPAAKVRRKNEVRNT